MTLDKLCVNTSLTVIVKLFGLVIMSLVLADIVLLKLYDAL